MHESTGQDNETPEALLEAVQHLGQCLDHTKCWSCGCFLDAITRLDEACPSEYRFTDLLELMNRAAQIKREAKYDCKGCDVCYPALAANALNLGPPDLRFGLNSCGKPVPATRDGWPPLPGEYEINAYQAPVAVCTLNSTNLAVEISRRMSSSISIAGPLRTENLGIERVITNVVTNPFIRFLILCGLDSKRAVGHLPGQSFLALAENGVDEAMRINGARGKRPVLLNASAGAVDHFLQTVRVVDMIGNEDVFSIIRNADKLSDENPAPARPFYSDSKVRVINGYVPTRVTPDPSGYIVIHLDRSGNRIYLEHYQNSGVIDAVVQGRTAGEVYIPAIENGLISRLDHAAYLGRELANAELALKTGRTFVQDAAPEKSKQREAESCPCTSCC